MIIIVKPESKSGPEVIKHLSSSTQLSIKFKLLFNARIAQNKLKLQV